jgi:hypothetical protein
VEGSKIDCVKKPLPPTQFEKLQLILNGGLEYIYQKALLNFSLKGSNNLKVDDEFNNEITDTYCGMECIVCSNYLEVCRCYSVETFEKESNELYGHFIDIEKQNTDNPNTMTTTKAVVMHNKIINCKIGCD